MEHACFFLGNEKSERDGGDYYLPENMSSSSSSSSSEEEEVNWADELETWDETLSEGTRGDHTYTWFGSGEVILDADLFDVNECGSFAFHGDAEGLANEIYDHKADGWRFDKSAEGIRMCTSCKVAIMEMFRRHGFVIRLREDPSPQYNAGGYYFVVDGWSDPRPKKKRKMDAPPPPTQKTARDEVEEFIEGHSGLSPGAKTALRAAIRACNVCVSE